MLEFIKVIIYGIIQGISEWLPISSTGHLLVAQDFMPLTSVSPAFLEMFNVVIQLGSILAVVVLFFHKLNPFSPKKNAKQKNLTIQLWIKVAIASIPAAVIGLLFNDKIDELFFNVYVVAAMLVIYGILFILVERRNAETKPTYKSIASLSTQTVLLIGGFQVLALIPGTSRSGATIIGALILGVSRGVAAEFSFFLAIPVMFGASLLKLISFGANFSGNEFALLVVGFIVSFAVSIVAIRFLMDYVKRNDFKIFGYYRIVFGALLLIFFAFRTFFAAG